MHRDMKIRRDIEAELAAASNVDARRIGVAVKDGIVCLTGRVGSHAERRTAEVAAQGVTGVKAIANDLVAGAPVDREQNDADIAAAVVEGLNADATVPSHGIRIVVHDGCVELQGHVNNWQQKQAAERAAMSVKGVKSLVSDIAIHAEVAPGEIASKIEEALRQSAQLDPGPISVGVSGARVTLEGQVGSLQERHQAELAAWAAPGVSEVIDKLAVVPSCD